MCILQRGCPQIVSPELGREKNIAVSVCRMFFWMQDTVKLELQVEHSEMSREEQVNTAYLVFRHDCCAGTCLLSAEILSVFLVFFSLWLLWSPRKTWSLAECIHPLTRFEKCLFRLQLMLLVFAIARAWHQFCLSLKTFPALSAVTSTALATRITCPMCILGQKGNCKFPTLYFSFFFIMHYCSSVYFLRTREHSPCLFLCLVSHLFCFCHVP